MKALSLFTGLKIPDSSNLLFALHVQGECCFFPTEFVFLHLTVTDFETTGTITIPFVLNLGLFATTYQELAQFSYKSHTIYCDYQCGQLMCRCPTLLGIINIELLFADTPMTTFGVTSYNFVTHQREAYGEHILDENTAVYPIHDFTDALVGYTTKDTILYHTSDRLHPTKYNTQTIVAALKKAYNNHAVITDDKLPVAIKAPATKPKYYLSAMLLIKDENQYLEEWLTLNQRAGFEHFYIYDNADVPNVLQYIARHLKQFLPLVTVVPFHAHYHLQYEVFDHFLNTYGDETRWASCIDSDEIYEYKKESLPTFLRSVEEQVQFIYIYWTIHNASGHVYNSDKWQSERFTKIVGSVSYPFGKYLFQPHCMNRIFTHSCSDTYAYGTIAPENLRLSSIPIRERCNFIPDYDIVLHHYITRSLEEFYLKMKRGSCDNNYRRAFDEFVYYNEDMKEQFRSFCQERGIGQHLIMEAHKNG